MGWIVTEVTKKEIYTIRISIISFQLDIFNEDVSRTFAVVDEIASSYSFMVIRVSPVPEIFVSLREKGR